MKITLNHLKSLVPSPLADYLFKNINVAIALIGFSINLPYSWLISLPKIEKLFIDPSLLQWRSIVN